MTNPQGWFTDPEDDARQRWWDGSQWTSQTRPNPVTKRSGSGRKWAIGVGVLVLALALYIGISAIAGNGDGGTNAAEPAAAATTSPALDPRSPEAIVAAAGTECEPLVQKHWKDERGPDVKPAAIIGDWSVTTADPGGGTPGSSWRLTAQYAVQIDPSGRGRIIHWDQTYFCDVEYHGAPGEYSATIVGG